MSASPIQPPSDYSLNMARDRLDDALMVLISECELSGEQIYQELKDRIRDTYQYYDKPRQELRKLLELVDPSFLAEDSPSPARSSWSEFRSYDDILDCPDLFAESVLDSSDLDHLPADSEEPIVESYRLSDRSIKSESYDTIVKLFEDAFKRDIRSFSFSADLFSLTGMDMLSAELVDLWNNYIVPSIVLRVNEQMIVDDLSLVDSKSQSCSLNIDIINPRTYERRSVPRGNKYDVYYHYNHIPVFHTPDDFSHIKTLFDLIHAYEQALEDHREYVNLIERCDY